LCSETAALFTSGREGVEARHPATSVRAARAAASQLASPSRGDPHRRSAAARPEGRERAGAETRRPGSKGVIEVLTSHPDNPTSRADNGTPAHRIFRGRSFHSRRCGRQMSIGARSYANMITAMIPPHDGQTGAPRRRARLLTRTVQHAPSARSCAVRGHRLLPSRDEGAGHGVHVCARLRQSALPSGKKVRRSGTGWPSRSQTGLPRNFPSRYIVDRAWHGPHRVLPPCDSHLGHDAFRDRPTGPPRPP
jgi:hypothetical protein